MSDKTPTIFEGSITTGNSPVTLTLKDTQGHAIRGLTVVNTGNVSFTVNTSVDGGAYGDDLTLERGDIYNISVPVDEPNGGTIDQILLTRISADANYRVIASAAFVGYNKSRKNTSDTATIPAAFVVTTTTSLKISDANTERIFFHVNNNNTADAIWIKLQAASVDNVKKGIFVPAGERWEMPAGDTYTGEISAIADNTTTNTYTTEY